MTNIITVQIDIDKFLGEKDKFDAFYKLLREEIKSQAVGSYLIDRVSKKLVEDNADNQLIDAICAKVREKWGTPEAISKELNHYYTTPQRLIGKILDERKDLLENEVLRYMATTDFQKNIAKKVEENLVARVEHFVMPVMACENCDSD